MILELTLVSGAAHPLPGYLQGRLKFQLYVNVTPVNDPPLLEIPTAKVLRLAQVSCKNKRLASTIDFPPTLFILNRKKIESNVFSVETQYKMLPCQIFALPSVPAVTGCKVNGKSRVQI